MDMRDLETVLAVSNYKSWTEAAWQTFQSLSSVSKRVSKLEGELGAQLFDRSSRGARMILTPEGELALPYISQMSDIYKQILDYADEAKNERTVLTVGYLPLIGTVGETEILTRFHIENPEIRIEHKLRQSGELAQMLRQGQLDCAFTLILTNDSLKVDLFNSIFSDNIGVIPLWERDEQYIGISAEHPLASGNTIRITDLVGETFVFSSMLESSSFDAEYIKFFFNDELKNIGPDKIRRMDFIDRQTVIDYIARGCGVLPIACIPPENAEGIRFLRAEDVSSHSHAIFMYRKDKVSRGLLRLLDYVNDFCRENSYGTDRT